MQKFFSRHGEGKTKRLLMFASDTGSTVVTDRKLEIIDKARKYGIVGLKVMSFEEFSEVDAFLQDYVVDNIDSYISYFYPTCQAYSMDTN